MERHPRATPTQPAWNSNITEQCGRGRPCAPSVSTPYRVPVCACTRRVPYIVYIVSRTYRTRIIHIYANIHTHTSARDALRTPPRRMHLRNILSRMHVLQSRRSDAFSVALTTVPLRVSPESRTCVHKQTCCYRSSPALSLSRIGRRFLQAT